MARPLIDATATRAPGLEERDWSLILFGVGWLKVLNAAIGQCPRPFSVTIHLQRGEIWWWLEAIVQTEPRDDSNMGYHMGELRVLHDSVIVYTATVKGSIKAVPTSGLGTNVVINVKYQGHACIHPSIEAYQTSQTIHHEASVHA